MPIAPMTTSPAEGFLVWCSWIAAYYLVPLVVLHALIAWAVWRRRGGNGDGLANPTDAIAKGFRILGRAWPFVVLMLCLPAVDLACRYLQVQVLVHATSTPPRPWTRLAFVDSTFAEVYEAEPMVAAADVVEFACRPLTALPRLGRPIEFCELTLIILSLAAFIYLVWATSNRRAGGARVWLLLGSVLMVASAVVLITFTRRRLSGGGPYSSPDVLLRTPFESALSWPFAAMAGLVPWVTGLVWLSGAGTKRGRPTIGMVVRGLWVLWALTLLTCVTPNDLVVRPLPLSGHIQWLRDAVGLAASLASVLLFLWPWLQLRSRESFGAMLRDACRAWRDQPRDLLWFGVRYWAFLALPVVTLPVWVAWGGIMARAVPPLHEWLMAVQTVSLPLALIMMRGACIRVCRRRDAAHEEPSS